jgi:hypothetical protein
MNIRVLHKKWIYRPADRLLASQGLRYVEFVQKEYTVREEFRDADVSVKNKDNFCQYFNCELDIKQLERRSTLRVEVAFQKCKNET